MNVTRNDPRDNMRRETERSGRFWLALNANGVAQRAPGGGSLYHTSRNDAIEAAQALAEAHPGSVYFAACVTGKAQTPPRFTPPTTWTELQDDR